MADLITHLVTHDVVGFLAMDTAVQHMRKVGGRLSSSILETTDIAPQKLLESIAEFHGLEYASDELLLSIDPDVPQFWRHDNALRLGAIPLALDASGLTLGVLEPLSQFQLEEVQEEYGNKIRQLLLLEFRFFELCNRFFDVVLEQRYAIWASKYPLQPSSDRDAADVPPPSDITDTSDIDVLEGSQPAIDTQTTETSSHEPIAADDVEEQRRAHTTESNEPVEDSREQTTESNEPVDDSRGQTTESNDPVEDHTLETESTDADDDDHLPPPSIDPTTILTGPRDAMDLLGGHDSFEAAFATHDDALLLLDDGPNPSKSGEEDAPSSTSSREHTPTHPQVLPSGDLSLDEFSAPRRGKEPSMPAIRIPPQDSAAQNYRSGSLHTPSRIDPTDAEEPYESGPLHLRGREPFPSSSGPTQVSGAFRIPSVQQRQGHNALVASQALAQKLGLVDAEGSWKQSDAIMDSLSEQESSYSRKISAVDIRSIYQNADRIEDLLYPTLTYFGAFFERRFLMHFWQPYRSTGLLMQGVRDHSSAFSRIEVPYDESSGVHKMRVTGNYLQGSPIDIGFLTLYTRLGIPTAKEAIAMPIYIGKEVVMMVVMDNGPDHPLDDTLGAREIALILQQLGRKLEELTSEDTASEKQRPEQPTPIDGESATAPPEQLSADAPLIPAELLDDVELPPATNDDLELEMDSMQMDPVEDDGYDDLTFDSIEEFFGPQFKESSSQHRTQHTEGSDSFEIAISTDQELSPAAKALLEQDTRHNDQRAVSIIVGDDERSDADLAYDLIPPTPSDLIRPPEAPENKEPSEDSGVSKVSRTTARHHALSGHNQYGEDDPSAAEKSPQPAKEPTPAKSAAEPATSAQWNARDLARLLRVGSTEFPLPENTASARSSDTTHQDTAEQEADSKLQDTAEQEADSKLQDTAEQEADSKLQDTAEQEADSKLQDTAEQEADSKLQDTAEQEADSKLQDTAEQEADSKLQDTSSQDLFLADEDSFTEAFSLDLEPAENIEESAPQTAEIKEENSDPSTATLDAESAKPSASNDTQAEATDAPVTDTAENEHPTAPDPLKTHNDSRPQTPLPEDTAPSTTPSATQISAVPPQPKVDEEAAAQLRKILQERQAAKAQKEQKEQKQQRAKTRLEETVDAPQSQPFDLTSEDDAPQETAMFSPQDMVETNEPSAPKTQKTHVVSPRIRPNDPPKAPAAQKERHTDTPTSKEIDLDAVLKEVDEKPAAHDVDKIASELARKLPGAEKEGGTASLVRLRELTESQRRMGTAAVKPLSLAMETLLRGAPQDRDAALQELLKRPVDELPDIHSEFPGPLDLDRTDPEQARRPLSEHGPLLAFVDARLYDFVPQLWACLERRSADARYYALRFLSLIRDLERRFVLVETALDPDAQIRELALRNIENFRNSPDFLLALESFQDRLDDDEATIRRAAIEALVFLRSHDAIEAIIKRLNDPDEDVRNAAHQGLKRLTYIDCGPTFEAWEQWRVMHGRELPEQWLVDAMDAVEPIRRALAARALDAIDGLVVNYHPDMSQQGLMRAKMAVERHFGLRR